MFPRITRRCMGTSFNITEKTIEEDNLLPALLGLFIGAFYWGCPTRHFFKTVSRCDRTLSGTTATEAEWSLR
jgi:hypothetical protein